MWFQRHKTHCRWLRWTVTGLLTLLLAACGGGGSGGSGSVRVGSSATYTSVAGAGELLTYTLDTRNLTYSYRIIDSNYGLQGSSGSGTLIANGNGTYTPKGMPNVRVVPAQNGMLLGAVALTINGKSQIVPLIGLPNLVKTITGIQGDYNYVEGVCSDSTRSSCSASYGTFHVDSGGTWASCTQADYTADPTNCNGHQRSTGTLNYLGKGRWQILSAGGVQIGTTMGFQAPNGQKVLLIDLSQPTAQGGLGVGLVAGSTRASVTTNTTTGTWLYAGLGYAGTLTASGKTYTGQNFGGNSYSASMTLNSPWAGFVTSSNGADALLAGTCVYAAANPGTGDVEVGLRYQ